MSQESQRQRRREEILAQPEPTVRISVMLPIVSVDRSFISLGLTENMEHWISLDSVLLCFLVKFSKILCEFCNDLRFLCSRDRLRLPLGQSSISFLLIRQASSSTARWEHWESSAFADEKSCLLIFSTCIANRVKQSCMQMMACDL